MIEKCQLAAAEISAEEVVYSSSVKAVVDQMESLRVTRLIITDKNGLALYDSYKNSQQNKLMLLPEIVQALDGNDVFSSNYHDGALQSRAATPIISYGTIIGCVYMMEYDTQLGALIKTLQYNTFYISVVLELCVTIFAVFFSNSFTNNASALPNVVAVSLPPSIATPMTCLFTSSCMPAPFQTNDS